MIRLGCITFKLINLTPQLFPLLPIIKMSNGEASRKARRWFLIDKLTPHLFLLLPIIEMSDREASGKSRRRSISESGPTRLNSTRFEDDLFIENSDLSFNRNRLH